MGEPKPRKRYTKVSKFHYFRLVFRGLLFLFGLLYYISMRLELKTLIPNDVFLESAFIIAVWVIFVVEMIFRFFPSSLESPGCEKQFPVHYEKTGSADIKIQDNHATFLVAIVWIVPNAIVGAFRMAELLDDGIMILLCLAYSVCDMICILFFCPFQTWFLKNKCCVTCRIYNWDYAMMFTPLFFVKAWYSWSLLLLAVGLLIRWEITVFRHPERFAETTNAYLSCENCPEKLCTHKKQLKRLWETTAELTRKRIEHLTK